MRGTLEGIESAWDSPGLGSYEADFDELPVLGRRFNFGSLRTGRVLSIKRFSPTEIRFRTAKSTYILTHEELT